MARRKFPRLVFGLLSAAIIIGAIIYIYLQVYCERCPVIRVYFIKEGAISSVERLLRPDEEPLGKAFSDLLKGPNLREQGLGYSTLIPKGTRLLSGRLEGKTAILNFNSKLMEHGEGASYVRGMIAQIVYTATGLHDIDYAWIQVEGKKNIVLGGDGLVLEKPLSREDASY